MNIFDPSFENPVFFAVLRYLIIFFWLGIGRWIAIKSWNCWKVEGNNWRLARFLFPYFYDNRTAPCDSWNKDKGMFVTGSSTLYVDDPPTAIKLFISSHEDDPDKAYRKKAFYFIFVILFWPIKIYLNLIYLLFCVVLHSISLCFRSLKGLWLWLIPKDSNPLDD